MLQGGRDFSGEAPSKMSRGDRDSGRGRSDQRGGRGGFQQHRDGGAAGGGAATTSTASSGGGGGGSGTSAASGERTGGSRWSKANTSWNKPPRFTIQQFVMSHFLDCIVRTPRVDVAWSV